MSKIHELKPEKELLREYSLQIASRLVQLRREKGLRQVDVAEAVDLPQSLISYFESGWSNPTLENLAKLSQFYGLRVIDLLQKPIEDLRVYNADESRFEEVTLPYQRIWTKDVLPTMTISICVNRGYIFIRTSHLRETKFLRTNQSAILPGGGKLEVIGVGEDESRVNVVSI